MKDPAKVESLFSDIAQRYDTANHVLSFGMDYYWRKQLVRAACAKNPQLVCDLATGSGDVAFALKKHLGESEVVRGYDFCEAMLEQARKKKCNQKVDFYKGDCMQLPLEDNSVDVLTIAFGLRNLPDRKVALKEMCRVLKKPGGVLCVLEFSQPKPMIRWLYYFYLKNILPFVAWIATGNREAYQYLGDTIEGFPTHAEISKEMECVGFRNIQVKRMTCGVVALHRGVI